jgi:zinc protease
VEKKMNPTKAYTEMKMGEMTVYKMVFDGGKGYQQQGPQKADFSEVEIKESMDDNGVIPQLNYTNKEYVGKGKVGDEETYRLKITLPSGRVSVQQYSSKTGLLLQEETTSKQADVDVPVTVEYKDYKKVGAILMPHNIIRNSAGQEFNIVYTSIKINEGVADADFK